MERRNPVVQGRGRNLLSVPDCIGGSSLVRPFHLEITCLYWPLIENALDKPALRRI